MRGQTHAGTVINLFKQATGGLLERSRGASCQRRAAEERLKGAADPVSPVHAGNLHPGLLPSSSHIWPQGTPSLSARQKCGLIKLLCIIQQPNGSFVAIGRKDCAVSISPAHKNVIVVPQRENCATCCRRCLQSSQNAHKPQAALAAPIDRRCRTWWWTTSAGL